MSFSSIHFIFYFLPIFLLLYYLIPGKWKDVVLVTGSLLFYAWGNPIYIILMLLSMFFNWLMGIDIEKAETSKQKKASLVFAVIINLFILCFFKYFGFLLQNLNHLTGLHITALELGLPLGISFYTFKNLSYLFDVNKGKIEAENNLFQYLIYSTMFPHMTQGPIVRYSEIQTQLPFQNRKLSKAKFGIGAEFFIKGLAKKILLADNLGMLFSSINQSGDSTVLSAWIGIIAYTLQIYFDFSGYSDMAIGLGKMLGFDFGKNFDYPYTSHSVSEFWRRWHISLGSWFRDYIYIPLGGNRVSTIKHIRNILIVWALTGLWHGASWNFVLWGVYYGILLLIEKFLLNTFLSKAPKSVTNLYTLLMIVIGWVFFSQTRFSGIGNYFGHMFGFTASGFLGSTTLYYLKTNGILLILGILFARPEPQKRFRRLMRSRRNIAITLDILLFLLCIAFMVYNSYSPFLYANF